MLRNVPSILLAIILLGMPAAALVEQSEIELWNNRLLWPLFSPEPDRHTPILPLGTFLPPLINRDMTFTRADNPVILAGITTIPAHATLTIEAGTRVVIHEYGQLKVQGQLLILGTASEPVHFTSNEEHVENRVWGGLVLNPASRSVISHATFRYASPAISCLGGSQARIDSITIELGNLGIFTSGDHCAITNSTLRHVRDGMISLGPEPKITNTTISASRAPTSSYDSL